MKKGVLLVLGMAVLAALVYFAVPTSAQTLSSEERAKLQAEYDKLQEEIAQWQKVLDDTKAKKNTLQGDVTILNAQIKKAEAEIRSRNGTISKLAGEIQEKNKRIQTLEERLEDGRASLAKLIREKHELETTPLAILMLSGGDFSEVFAEMDAIDVINANLQDHFDELRGVREETEKEKQVLDEKKNAEQDAKYEVEVKREQIKQNETEKQELLNITKKDEVAYSQVLADRQARAAEIYARLFPLRDTGAIKFGDAVAYAKTASGKTGVRPAFILAVLSQESDLGSNVGNCLVTNLETGDGKGKNTGTPFAGVMKAPRDTVPFERITKELGKDWRTTPVSCPQAGGYGGAMGPTQFIPSTWELFESRIKSALGVPNTNPWNAGHAIMATGLYLMDAGAALQTYTAERNAACRYFSGRACPGGGWIDNYASSVIAKANQFQKDIEDLADL
jgi:peptidoglycan hydrolase CwlO-like protein